MTGRGIVVLLGAPGAGKGTQAKRLSEKFDFTHVSTGDALRKAANSGSPLGKQVGEIMAAGELVPDQLVGEIVGERMRDSQGPGSFLLDGFPRNLAQAKVLEELLENGAPQLVINIRVSEDLVVKRLSGRRQCKRCGKIYNVYFSPPGEEGNCDACGGKLIQRRDDREDVIQERLRVYREETEPLIDFYSKNNQYVEVDGEQDPQEVFEEILSKTSLEERLAGGTERNTDGSMA